MLLEREFSALHSFSFPALQVEPDEDTPWQGRGGIEDLMFQAEDEEDEDPDLADDPNKDVDLKECIRHELQARRHRLS